MMDIQREILQKVADGELSAAEAEERLRALDDDGPRETPSDPTAPLRLVEVVGSFRTASIVGDPDVREAVVEGRHTAARDGDVLRISAEEHEQGETGNFRFEHDDRRVKVTLGPGSKPLPLKVRMNPALALDVSMAAGALKIKRVRGPIKANVSAGAIRIEGFAAPIDLQVAGGAVNADGTLTEGESRIRCEAGSVRVKLTKESSVKVVARAGLGKVALPGVKAASFIGGGTQEAVVGDGVATLEIDASLGAVNVEQA